MTTAVFNCPRCKAENSTFDCFSSNLIGIEYGWKAVIEVFSVCRNCHKGSILIAERKENRDAHDKYFKYKNSLCEWGKSLNDIVDIVGYISKRHEDLQETPRHLPDIIDLAMREGNACLAIGCWNASSAMYRSALDLATKGLLPDDTEKAPTNRIRRSLGLRLGWLLGNGLLPADLADLADCIKEVGNDGVHDVSLEAHDAQDIHDFAYELLRRLYTEPARIELAKARRIERRKDS